MGTSAEDPVSHQTDDDALIAQARQGEVAAFDQLVLRHQSQVYAVALRMLGDRDEAQDAAQDAFIRAYQSLKGFRQDAKLSTWLVAITMNLCRNRRRWWARRRRIIVASVDDPVDTDEGDVTREVADPGPSPRDTAVRREQQQRLMATLQLLDQADREVIVLRDIQGYSYEEIAQMLGCELGTVKSRLNRARCALRAKLDGKL